MPHHNPFTSIVLYTDTIPAAYLRILPSSHLTHQLRRCRPRIIGGFMMDRFFNCTRTTSRCWESSTTMHSSLCLQGDRSCLWRHRFHYSSRNSRIRDELIALQCAPLRINDYVSRWRTRLNRLESAGRPFDHAESLRHFVKHLPTTLSESPLSSISVLLGLQHNFPLSSQSLNAS